MDVLILSRIQFALNIAFHYFYPPLSIGLSLMIVIIEGMYIKTKSEKYKKMAQFWTRIFALSFALGVATGIVQVFAFGNNWSRFARFVGDVFGSALAAEGIFAFFLEAGFIGLMLFGWERVSARLHYFSTICVALGAHFSAIWIVAANSWMQTPQGFKLVGEGVNRRAVITDFWGVIFNPSFLDRLTHVIIGCWLTGAFIVLSVCSYYYLKKKHTEFARIGMKLGLAVAAILLVLQLISADYTARGVAKYQPEKLAAMEGVYETRDHTPMTVAGYVDTKEQVVKGIKIPSLLSFLVYRNFKTPVTGLNDFPETDWPNVAAVFQMYHLMIFMWGAMVIMTLLGFIFYKRKTLDKAKWTLRGLVVSILFPYIANQSGWFTAEMGRQPWVVYHVLRTADGVSTGIRKEQVVGSIIMFILIYILLFSLFLFLMNRKIQTGPEGESKPGYDDAVFSDPYKKGV